MYGPGYEEIIREASRNLGLGYRQHGTKCIALTLGHETQYIWSRRFPQNPAASARLIDSKCMCSTVLESAGVPVVKHTKLYRSDLEEYSLQTLTSQKICEDLLDISKGVVIKPNDSCEGVDVYACFTPKEIEHALYLSFGKKTILAVAPYIKACTEYRVIYLNGEGLLIYKKMLPVVIGDGKTSLKNLISNVDIDIADLDASLDLDLIPAVGENVTVGWKYNLSRGSTPELVDDPDIVDKLLTISIKAANVVRARFVSVDILEDEDTHDFYVLEINAGVAMDKFIEKHPQGRKIAYGIYEKSIKDMFHLSY